MLRRLRIANLVLIEEAELELHAGLNAITGETGAGKTILAGAFGLLLGARGDAALIGAAGDEAYVEAEFDAASDELLGPLADLRPEGEDGLVLARRIFADGRTRAYAWGRAAAREDVAAAAEALIAMSGQFEQRRLARAAYRLAVLDAYAGVDTGEARLAWRRTQEALRRYDEVTRDAAAVQARLDELQALADDTDGLEAGREAELRVQRERLRHVTELAAGAAEGAAALAPDDGDGAADLVAAAERALQPVEHLAPELRTAGDTLRQAELQLRETASELRGFLGSLDAEPAGSSRSETELDRLADLRRRFKAETFAELVDRGAEARAELAELDGGLDPAGAAAAELESAERELVRIHDELTASRQAARRSFADAVAGELAGLGLGEGEFAVELQRARARADRSRRGGLPDPPERRSSVRARLRDRLGRRAVTDRTGAGRGRGRRDARLRRDRRRRRRHDRARRRRDSPAAGEPCAGRHDHAPAADRQRSRPSLSRREGGRRPDPHADRRRSTTHERRDEVERMLGGASLPGLARALRRIGLLDSRGELRRVQGHARLDRRTKHLTRRVGPDDVAIIDHADLDRVSAEELVESGVRVVVNVAQSQTGRFPNPGPLELVRGGVRLIDAPGADLFETVSEGELLSVRGAGLYRNGTCLANGSVLVEEGLTRALDDQRSTRNARPCEAFAENTLELPARRGPPL